MLSMMGVHYAISSFVALLVNKSLKKTERGKIKKLSTLQKKNQNHFWSRKYCQVTNLRDLKSFVGH